MFFIAEWINQSRIIINKRFTGYQIYLSKNSVVNFTIVLYFKLKSYCSWLLYGSINQRSIIYCYAAGWIFCRMNLICIPKIRHGSPFRGGHFKHCLPVIRDFDCYLVGIRVTIDFKQDIPALARILTQYILPHRSVKSNRSRRHIHRVYGHQPMEWKIGISRIVLYFQHDIRIKWRIYQISRQTSAHINGKIFWFHFLLQRSFFSYRFPDRRTSCSNQQKQPERTCFNGFHKQIVNYSCSLSNHVPGPFQSLCIQYMQATTKYLNPDKQISLYHTGLVVSTSSTNRFCCCLNINPAFHLGTNYNLPYSHLHTKNTKYFQLLNNITLFFN